MSNAIHNNFRLLGYKINEFSNGYFLTRSPNGSEGLFDSEGKVIMNNLSKIERVSDSVYIGTNTENNKSLIFDNKCNIIDDNITKMYTHDNFIFAEHLDRNEIIIYDKGFTVKFIFKGNDRKILENSSILKIVNVSEEYNIAIIDANNHLKRVDMNMQVAEIHPRVNLNCRQISDKYITKYIGDSAEGEMEIIDYKGDTVCRGKAAYIDTVNKDSDMVAVYTGTTIDISSEKLKFKRYIHLDTSVRNVRFTTHPHVIIISTEEAEYMFNMNTAKRTKYYNRMWRNIGWLSNGNMYVIDIETFQEKLVLTNVNSVGMSSDDEISIRHSDRNQHYTLDFKPLIHEFY